MGYSQNFDEQSSGQSPTNWDNDPGLAPTTLDISTVQYNSSPNSMRMVNSTGGNVGCKLDYQIDEQTVEIMVYLAATNKNVLVLPNDGWQLGGAGGLLGPYCGFWNNGQFGYYVSGYNFLGAYSTGWHKVTIVIDLTADTYDLYLDDGLEASDVNFYSSNTQTELTRLTLTSSTGATTYYDDLLIGTAGWTGKVEGVTNPAKVNGVAVGNIASVNGVT